jgi:membrane protein DedA with SNARE-associated domain
MELQKFGIPGIFLVELIANASIILPIPGSAITAAVSPLFNPVYLIMAASLGAALGEMTGYLAGLGGKEMIEKTKWHARVREWVIKYGGIVILILAAIPNPLFDMAGITAGMLHMPAWKFFAWCWTGKLVNRTAVVLGGAALIRMLPFMHESFQVVWHLI